MGGRREGKGAKHRLARIFSIGGRARADGPSTHAIISSCWPLGVIHAGRFFSSRCASESDENVKAARGRQPSDMRERVGGSWWRAMNESRYL